MTMVLVNWVCIVLWKTLHAREPRNLIQPIWAIPATLWLTTHG